MFVNVFELWYRERYLNLRTPFGNEMGANNLWIPGGKLPTNHSKAVVNRIPLGQYQETLLQTH